MRHRRIKTLATYGLLFVAVLFIVPLLLIASQNPGAAAGLLSFFAVGFIAPGTKIFDWEKAKGIGTVKELKEEISAAFNKYIEKINKKPLKKKDLFSQKFTGPDSAFAGAAPVVLIQTDRATPDRGYERIFDPVNMRQATSRTFEVMDITGGVTYYQVTDGEPVKLSRVPKGAKTSCSMLRFLGGFSILDDWLKFNEFYKIDQLSARAIKDWYRKRATLMYGLLTALTGIDQTFATDDATTINNACANILNDLDALGYDVGDATEFVITANPMLKTRIRKALKASFENPGNNANEIEYTISAFITTPKITDTTHYWISVPGEKNLIGDWDDFNTRPAQRNELVLGADYVSTGAYNGIIAEKKQHKKCALS